MSEWSSRFILKANLMKLFGRSPNLELGPCHLNQLMMSRDPDPGSFLLGGGGGCSGLTVAARSLTYCGSLPLLTCSSTSSLRWRHSSVVCPSSSWNMQYFPVLRFRSVGSLLGGFR